MCVIVEMCTPQPVRPYLVHHHVLVSSTTLGTRYQNTHSHALNSVFTFTPPTYSHTHLAQMSLLSSRHGKNYPGVNCKITMCVTDALVYK